MFNNSPSSLYLRISSSVNVSPFLTLLFNVSNSFEIWFILSIVNFWFFSKSVCTLSRSWLWAWSSLSFSLSSSSCCSAFDENFWSFLCCPILVVSSVPTFSLLEYNWTSLKQFASLLPHLTALYLSLLWIQLLQELQPDNTGEVTFLYSYIVVTWGVLLDEPFELLLPPLLVALFVLPLFIVPVEDLTVVSVGSVISTSLVSSCFSLFSSTFFSLLLSRLQISCSQ